MRTSALGFIRLALSNIRLTAQNNRRATFKLRPPRTRGVSSNPIGVRWKRGYYAQERCLDRDNVVTCPALDGTAHRQPNSLQLPLRRSASATYSGVSNHALSNSFEWNHRPPGRDRNPGALDSRGRFVRKSISTSGSGHQTINFSVYDRIAQTITNWTVPGVRVTVSSSAPPITSTCHQIFIKEKEETVNRPIPAIEDLGTETIAGIQAHGTRTITTEPKGEYGNNPPLISTEEVWVATDPGLKKLEVRRLSEHPLWDFWDQRSTEPVNLRLGEPDASLFEPPLDYEVVTLTEQARLSKSCTSTPTPKTLQH